MSKGVQASLGVAVAVFGFNPDADTAPTRALHVLTVRRGLPHAEVGTREKLTDAALRAVAEAGMETGRRGKSALKLTLVGFDDAVSSRGRGLCAWYYATAPYLAVDSPGAWSTASRGTRLTGSEGDALKVALDRLRAETRQVAGAAGLIGDVFTGDDLLRLHIALHGGPEGSERTFRRRVQELRDLGVLKPVKHNEVAALRLRVPRFRSPAGTGGRPPELLRYSGNGGDEEQLASLRARRSA